MVGLKTTPTIDLPCLKHFVIGIYERFQVVMVGR